MRRLGFLGAYRGQGLWWGAKVQLVVMVIPSHGCPKLRAEMLCAPKTEMGRQGPVRRVLPPGKGTPRRK